MASVYGTLFHWARRTTTSFAEFVVSGFDRTPPGRDAGDSLVYRLKQWPDLMPSQKSADVLRTLSVMSHRPVNRAWILSTSRLKPEQVDSLLASLERQDAVEVTDTSRFTPSQL
jgi:hypothetical protein